MAFLMKLALCLSLLLTSPILEASTTDDDDPTPAPWPDQFHSLLFANNTGILQKADLWYDLELNNGTFYMYTLDSNRECTVSQLQVGILTPNWLEGAKYLGQRYRDKFLCNVWEKVDFVWYYEDVVSKIPVSREFYNGNNCPITVSSLVIFPRYG
ncbi:hypothetical protein LguiA_028437 [Lonicera macranthoides]